MVMQQRRATAARWLAINEVLAAGQIGVETDTGQVKAGNGVDRWADLPYVGSGGGAPTNAEYLVGALHGGLSAERLVTNTATVTWDLSTPGQAKANAVGGSGDSITVNGSALVDADFDDATPAPPAGEVNVKWQKDAGSPANISASVQAATTTVKGVVELATDGESAANVVVQGNDARMSDARTPLAHVHAGADITTGTVAAARLGSGSGGATKFLREDSSYQEVANGGVLGVAVVKRLNTQHDIASTTGTEVTELSHTLVAGTYVFTYYLITQAANTTVGLALGLNYTGTVTSLAAFMRYADTGTTATTGVATDDTLGTAEGIHGIFATITTSTTACDLGPLTNHAKSATNTLIIVEGIIVVSNGGDLELWHNSDAATTTSIMVGSSLILQRTA